MNIHTTIIINKKTLLHYDQKLYQNSIIHTQSWTIIRTQSIADFLFSIKWVESSKRKKCSIIITLWLSNLICILSPLLLSQKRVLDHCNIHIILLLTRYVLNRKNYNCNQDIWFYVNRYFIHFENMNRGWILKKWWNWCCNRMITVRI